METYDGNVVDLVIKIIKRLKAGAKRNITITMSPLPYQLRDVDEIQRATDGMLDWVNVQMYDDMVWRPRLAITYEGYVREYKNLKAAHVVAGINLDADSCKTREDMCTYVGQIYQLANIYPGFGGVTTWEYLYVFDQERQFLQQWPLCTGKALLGERCQICGG